MDFVEGLRVGALILAAWLLVRIVVIALVMRHRADPAEKARQWGCYSILFFSAGMLVGNITHLLVDHQPPSVGIILSVCGVFCGLNYVAKVRADPAWRDK